MFPFELSEFLLGVDVDESIQIWIKHLQHLGGDMHHIMQRVEQVTHPVLLLSHHFESVTVGVFREIRGMQGLYVS